ncbi:MAG: DUF1294 domain-containing protein [Clostridia bacterium]|nr:DUF1294 domain-containing protein [Clostridia bacterium]
MPQINFNITTLLFILNILTFLLFGFDKIRAKKKGYRIPEAVLILLSLFFGGVGAMLGMVIFNHKTNRMPFRIIVPLSFVLNYIFSYDSFRLFKAILKAILQIIPE